MLKLMRWVLLAGLASATTAGAAELPFQITSERLDNGLTLLMVPYASPGLISYNTLVRVGSRDEVEKGVTGFAHFFEHMMFRGTKSWPPERVSAYLKKAGADQNGFTTNDFTCYTFFGRSDFLEELVEMEADRFQNLEYSEDVFKTESKAVLGEYNKSASSPYLPLDEKLRELAFLRHTYGHTTLGYLKDIEDMPNQFAYSKSFFQRFYTPDNATIIAAGDLDPAVLGPLVKKHYASWKGRRAETKVQVEPPQTAERRAEIAWKAPTLPLLYLNWRAPAGRFDSPETAAQVILFELLFGKVSAAYTELVLDKQQVEGLDGDNEVMRDPFVFSVLARVKDKKDLAVVEARLERAVAELAAGKLDPRLLEDVKSNVRYGRLIGLDSPDKVAMAIAFTTGKSGQADALLRLLGAIEKVTPQQVQAFARKHLVKKNKSVVVLKTEEGVK